MPRRPKIPENIHCENCGKLMLAESYSAQPLPDTPAERIHRIWEPSLPPRTVLCTCGHYTAHVRSREGAQR
jgi:hypothetical protein